LTPAAGRRFAATVAAGFAALGLLLLWRGGPLGAGICGALALLLLLAGLVAPTRLGPVERAWLGLGHAIARVTSPIVLGVLYFGVITPMGLVRRRAGSPIVRPPRPDSTWVERDAGQRRSDLHRQF
jgi:hypothetical protein